MSKEEFKRGMENVAGGINLNLQKKAAPIKCGKSILDNLKIDTLLPRSSTPALYYGGPAIRHAKPVNNEKSEQSVEPLTPGNPVKADDSEILK